MHKKKKNAFGNFMKEVGKDLKPIGKEVSKVVNEVASTPNHLIDGVAKVGSSLSLPLLLVGGAAAIYFITKK